MNDGRWVLVGLGAGLAGGLLIGASHNATLIGAADAIALLGTLWVNAIRMTVIPLVVSLLITGVASASDVSTIGRIGSRTIAVFIAMLAGATMLALPLGIGTFALLSASRPCGRTLPPGAADAAAALAAGAPAVGFASWLTSLIPTNPVAAAAAGAMLPLVLFTLLLALAIARSPADARDILVGVFRSLSEAMLVLVRWIVRLAPIGVFALMLPLGAHGGAGLVGAIGFYILAYSLASVLFVLLLYPLVALVARVPIRDFARAVAPAQTHCARRCCDLRGDLPRARAILACARIAGFDPAAGDDFHAGSGTLRALFVMSGAPRHDEPDERRLLGRFAISTCSAPRHGPRGPTSSRSEPRAPRHSATLRLRSLTWRTAA